jgi:hypothetical protein
LQAKPHKERQVAVQLHQRGLQVYLPLIWVNPINPRAARQRPYFPGYLFAQAAPWLAGHSLMRWSPGLKQVVEFDGEPASLTDSFVCELRQRLGQIRAVSSVVPDGPSPHEVLEIAERPFAGYEGIFYTHLSATVRTQILLTCIQQHHWQTKLAAAARPRANT